MEWTSAGRVRPRARKGWCGPGAASGPNLRGGNCAPPRSWAASYWRGRLRSTDSPRTTTRTPSMVPVAASRTASPAASLTS